jgi:hypothetical protein
MRLIRLLCMAPFFGIASFAGFIWHLVCTGFAFGREQCEEEFDRQSDYLSERATPPKGN